MKLGLIGLENVGGKLAHRLLNSCYSLAVHDIDMDRIAQFTSQGAQYCKTPAEIAESCDVIITCLPSAEISTTVVEGQNGILSGIKPGKIWCEMSTTDETEIHRLGHLVLQKGAHLADCPVSGGCHRAASGNISIFAGCERAIFEEIFPVLSIMGQKILHTGALGSTTVLKVITNYLASVNLLAICEALVTAKLSGLDLNICYEGIKISSGNSFVHETESQVILNGSRNINFTMDLVVKDTRLFHDIAKRVGIELELSQMVVDIFQDAMNRYGEREWSSNVIRRLEDKCGECVTAPGFPDELIDTEPESSGYEVNPLQQLIS